MRHSPGFNAAVPVCDAIFCKSQMESESEQCFISRLPPDHVDKVDGRLMK